MSHSLTTLLVGLVFAALSWGCEKHHGLVTVLNESGESASLVSIEVCSQKIDIRDLKAGDSASKAFDITCEGDYAIDVVFQSGRRLRAKVGYVPTGMSVNHKITLTNAKILFGSDDRPRT
jgi:hypothetical protein